MSSQDFELYSHEKLQLGAPSTHNADIPKEKANVFLHTAFGAVRSSSALRAAISCGASLLFITPLLNFKCNFAKDVEHTRRRGSWAKSVPLIGAGALYR